MRPKDPGAPEDGAERSPEIPGAPLLLFGRAAIPGLIPAGALLLVLAFFLRSFEGALSPFLLYLAIFALAAPFRHHRGAWPLLVTTGILTLLWLISVTGFLLAPFVLSLAIAYVLDPLVDRMARWRITRTLSIVLIGVPIAALALVALFFGIPVLAEQLWEIIRTLPSGVNRLADWVETLPERISLIDLPFLEESEVADRIRQLDGNAVVRFLEQRWQEIGRQLWSGLLGVGKGVGFLLTLIGYLVLTPVLTFYLLRDWDRIKTRLVDLVPPAHRSSTLGFFRDLDGSVAGYLRGQIIVATIMGTLTAFGLWALSFPYAFVLGVTAGLLGLIPYLGLILSLVPALAIALLTGNPGISLLKLVLVFGGGSILESSVISPRIVGGSTGLHPALVILSLTLGGFFFGFLGLVIAVPVAAGVKHLLLRALPQYRRPAFYRGAQEEDSL